MGVTSDFSATATKWAAFSLMAIVHVPASWRGAELSDQLSVVWRCAPSVAAMPISARKTFPMSVQA